MTLFLISFYMIILSMIFLQMIHPLAMGLIMLIQTFLTCLFVGSLTQTFWFSYILFIVFLGGLLVLFIYVSALASNEMFSPSMKIILFMIMTSLFFMIYFMFMDTTLTPKFSSNMEIKSIYNMNSYILENNLNLNKLYNFPSNLITLLLINYLLLTLIVIVKITNIFYGPLRQNMS
uniref:NADH-ubiquinone oxidoreductase chain 6 n=1 Tax=Cramptonomyia spenceri TaxID=209689 RepID=G8J8E8_9DIPT|nr:NADH dehydrogenase subunit 6 [Cramptonomyia spenceri]AET13066.1 NADH dehydrogenase subunit 6 [Cramptonomyia spenceri]